MTNETEFLMKHGENASDRLVRDLLFAIAETLEKHGVIYADGFYKIKRVGTGVFKRDGAHHLLIDVKNAGGFDHIEFCVTKTGWGK